MPLYSICTTCYNSVSCVDGFMEPFTKLSNDYELVIVDGGSTDGTYEKLLQYSNLNNFKLIRQKCSRGKGRQIAMEASSAPVVAHVTRQVGASAAPMTPEMQGRTRRVSAASQGTASCLEDR